MSLKDKIIALQTDRENTIKKRTEFYEKLKNDLESIGLNVYITLNSFKNDEFIVKAYWGRGSGNEIIFYFNLTHCSYSKGMSTKGYQFNQQDYNWMIDDLAKILQNQVVIK